MAEARSLPAYCILHDSALRHMARLCPQSEEQFAGVPGVGAKRASDFVAEFLAVIAEHTRKEPDGTAREIVRQA